MGTRAEVVVSIASSLRTSIDGLGSDDFYRNPTIHQILIDVRKGNESAYTPKVVSIGPYHRDVHQGSYLHEQTKGMKILFLRDFLNRTPPDRMKEYASLIESREKDARDDYYDRCNGLESKEFVQMMMLDGCFIIEYLLKLYHNERQFFYCKTEKYLRDLEDDLKLMENQIPFFILKLILNKYRQLLGGEHREPEILDLFLHAFYNGKITKEMFERTYPAGRQNFYHLLHLDYLCDMVDRETRETESPPETLLVMSESSGPNHIIEKTKRVLYLGAYGFLFLIKYFLLLFFYSLIYLLRFINFARKIMRQKPYKHKRQKVKEKENKPRLIPTATELNEFDVTFKRKKDAKNSIDVSFENSTMEIPLVLIEDSSNSKFRNYLALEQNCRDVENVFSRYVVIMDNLVDTTSDVALLKKSKIIESLLGCDEEVAKFFNGLTVGCVWDTYSSVPDKLFEDVRVHCKDDYNKWKAMLIRDYFSSPWSIISLFGAFTLLAFTATQVAYAIKTSHGM